MTETSRLRFTDAAQVFEAFPRLGRSISAPEPGTPPAEFARALLLPSPGFPAITFLAHLLPRREAVWWGCQCIRAVTPHAADDALAAAEAWVREPDEETRREALRRGDYRLTDHPGMWMALAAGQSGGSLAPEGGPPAAAPADATAINVKAGVILAIASRAAADQPDWTESCVEAGLRFALGEELKVIAPTPARPARLARGLNE